MAPKARFCDGEKVLCFHGPLLYEAKCLKSQVKDKHVKYFIHYSGWNKNWDEWVPDCRVLKCNEANLQKQKELEKTHMKAKKSKGAKVSLRKEPEKEAPPPVVCEKTVKPKTEKPKTEKPKTEKPKTEKPKTEKPKTEKPKTEKPKTEKKSMPAASIASSEPVVEIENVNPPKKKKLRKEEELSFLDDLNVRTEIRIAMPPKLRKWLVDDCDLVTRQKKLMQLPTRITVDHVIASFVKDRVSGKSLPREKEKAIVQVANKVRDSFNVLLGKSLLYKFERPYYAEILMEYNDCSMCQIYGSVHLLRMFTQFGLLLSPFVKTEPDMPALVEHLEDFLRYMATKESFFSLDDYIVASPEYHRRAL